MVKICTWVHILGLFISLNLFKIFSFLNNSLFRLKMEAQPTGHGTWDEFMEAEKSSNRPINVQRKNILTELGDRYLTASFLYPINNKNQLRIPHDYVMDWIEERLINWPLGRLVFRRVPNSEKFTLVPEYSSDLLFCERQLKQYLSIFLTESDIIKLIQNGGTTGGHQKTNGIWFKSKLIKDEGGLIESMPIWLKEHTGSWIEKLDQKFQNDEFIKCSLIVEQSLPEHTVSTCYESEVSLSFISGLDPFDQDNIDGLEVDINEWARQMATIPFYFDMMYKRPAITTVDLPLN